MKHEVPFRIIVDRPLTGVAMQVQNGRHDLLPPQKVTTDSLAFEFDVTVDISGERPNFLGKFSQGPKDSRFLYVNSGTSAGQMDSCWTRRAKLSLMAIGREQIEQVLTDRDKLMEAVMPGVGRDGGPTCASVKGLEWRVAKK